MSNLDIINIKFVPDGIGHYISDNFLEVPIYQRPYAWEEKNVYELLEDIHNSMSTEYFIGSIVVTPNNDKLGWVIVDGQQRIATIFILYVVFRDYMKKCGKNESSESFNNDFIYKRNRRGGDIAQKLKLGEDDNNFLLENIITGSQDIEYKKESHKRIYDAYKTIYRFIEDKVRLSNIDYIYDLDEFIQSNVKIIIVQVPNSANAFTVFETLNDRGLDLSKTDLIKNYLFNKSNSRIIEAQSRWLRISGAIEASLPEEELMFFIRCYWSSKYELIREKDLFSEIKSKITNINLSIKFLNELDENAKKYIALTNNNHELWIDFPNVSEYIYTFNNLRVKQNRPLLLAILNQFLQQEVKKSFKLILSWTVRNLITNTIPLGTLEREFSRQAKKINDGAIKNTRELRNSIQNLIPADDAFKDAFSVATVSKNFIATYYLKKIEEHYRASNELVIVENFDIVNIEHILPQNPDDLEIDWSNFDEENYKGWCKRIGNLTLMNTKMNSDIGNKAFNIKKDKYHESQIEITKKLYDYDEWGPSNITDRQKDFAEIAVQIWNTNIT